MRPFSNSETDTIASEVNTELRFHTRLLLNIGSVCVAFILVLLWGDSLDRTISDTFFKLRGPLPFEEDVIVVGVDDESFGNIAQQWPWSRTLHAQLFQSLKDAGARVIVFDLLFDTHSDEPEDDRVFQRAIDDGPPEVVLATARAVSETAAHAIERWLDPVFKAGSVDESVGAIDLPVDPDGVVRRGALSMFGRPSLGYLAAKTYARGDWQAPSDIGPTFLINFLEPPRTISTVSYYKVLNAHEDLPENSFRDKLVFVGSTTQLSVSPNRPDHFFTPFSRAGTDMSGVEIHANITYNLLRGNYLDQTSLSATRMLGLLLGFLCGLWFFKLKLIRAGALFMVVGCAGVWLAYRLFADAAYHLPLDALLIATSAAFVVSVCARYYEMRQSVIRSRRLLRQSEARIQAILAAKESATAQIDLANGIGRTRQINVFISYRHKAEDATWMAEILGFVKGLDKEGITFWVDEELHQDGKTMMGFERRGSQIVFAFVFCLTNWSTAVMSQVGRSVAQLVSVTGEVEVFSKSKRTWDPAEPGQYLYRGDAVRIGASGKAYIASEDGSRIHLNKNSRFVLKEVALAPGWLEVAVDRVRHSWYQLFAWKLGEAAEASIENNIGGVAIDVETPTIKAGVRGTRFVIRVGPTRQPATASRETSTVAILDGVVEVQGLTGPRNTVTAQAGYQVVAADGEPLKVTRLAITPTDAVQWTLYVPPLITPVQMPTASQYPALATALEEANKKIRSGDLEAAKTQLSALTKRYPQASAPYRSLAVVLLALNDNEAAFKAAQRATEIDPSSADAAIVLSYVNQSRFDLPQAMQETQRALALDPENRLAIINLARLKFGNGDIDGAWETLEEAGELAPRDAEIFNLRGFVRLARSEPGAAMGEFEQAIELDSRLGEPHLGLGLVHMRRGRQAEALRSMAKAVLLDPPSAGFTRSIQSRNHFAASKSFGPPVCCTTSRAK